MTSVSQVIYIYYLRLCVYFIKGHIVYFSTSKKKNAHYTQVLNEKQSKISRLSI